jgi:hypothetical protein
MGRSEAHIRMARHTGCDLFHPKTLNIVNKIQNNTTFS